MATTPCEPHQCHNARRSLCRMPFFVPFVPVPLGQVMPGGDAVAAQKVTVVHSNLTMESAMRRNLHSVDVVHFLPVGDVPVSGHDSELAVVDFRLAGLPLVPRLE